MMVRPVTEDDTGLKVLSEPSKQDSTSSPTGIIDIVAIHGIGAHPDDTWSKNIGSDVKPQYVNWLQQPEMLPATVPNARIMRYEYESQWFGDDTVDTEFPYRPLIFIAHCFGGLIVLKALRQAFDNTREWPGIFMSTAGLIFFGTPFRGTEGMKQSEMIKAALSEYRPDQVYGDSLGMLVPGDEFLQDTVDRFLETRPHQNPAPIACFYETKSSNVGAIVGGSDKKEFVVNAASGCLDRSDSVKKYPLARTHFDINKFGKASEPSYKAVRRVITEMVKTAPDLLLARSQSPYSRVSVVDLKRMEDGERKRAIDGSNSELSERALKRMRAGANDVQAKSGASQSIHRRLADLLRFDQIDNRRENIKTGIRNTCEWLRDDKAYIDWLNADEYYKNYGFFWIKGKPGCGKSTLMKFVFTRVNLLKDTTILSFFFNARGAELEKNTIGLYRSLLVQLLDVCPDGQLLWNIPGFNFGSPNATLQTSPEMLKRLLVHIMRLLHTPNVVLVVDALDECDENEIRDMISLFEELGAEATSKQRELRVLFSSRHYPHITAERSVQLILEDQQGHGQDVQQYVSSKLKAGRAKMVESIRREICNRSSGIFMWVVLVVEILNKVFDHGQVHAVRKKLQEIPDDLNDLFKDILTRDRQNMDEMLLCLQWVLFANRPLKREELYLAMLSGLLLDQDSTPWDPDETSLEDMAKFILSSSKGLAEITKSKDHTVQFIHESVKDFLLKKGGLNQIWPKPDTDADNTSLSHDRLKQCCYRYTSLKIVEHLQCSDNLPVASKPDELRKNAFSNFPFLDYATRQMFAHADIAQGEGIDQKPFLEGLELNTWVRINNIIERYKIRHLPPDIKLPYIFAEQDCPNLIGLAVQNDWMKDVEGGRYGNPVFAAIASKKYRTLEVLVKRTLEKHPNGCTFPYASRGQGVR
ncbi:hypothetical protein EG328_009103 [Venturia inaequalis]|uniref:Nephrocystin 3-like N-terminal domain-containing protein n=1 Tax=Venturia inaequalis TaxID=5025 RepID=A0A8H3UAW3_VENIN|nr:hypothetical protein EG328_009103 [Venturia inaequalis]